MLSLLSGLFSAKSPVCHNTLSEKTCTSLNLWHVTNTKVLRRTNQKQFSTVLGDRRPQFLSHIAMSDVRLDHTRVLRSVISGLPSRWKWPSSHSRQTWWTRIILHSDLNTLNIGGNGHRIVNNGVRLWKQLCSSMRPASDDDDNYDNCYISPICSKAHRGPICTKFGSQIRLSATVNYGICICNCFRGFDSISVKMYPSPLTQVIAITAVPVMRQPLLLIHRLWWPG